VAWLAIARFGFKYGPTAARLYWRGTGKLGPLKWPVRVGSAYAVGRKPVKAARGAARFIDRIGG